LSRVKPPTAAQRALDSVVFACYKDIAINFSRSRKNRFLNRF